MKTNTYILVSVLILSALGNGQDAPIPSPGPQGLTGWVDLHTHPLANVGFGGKLLYGGVDIGALLPADPDCNANVRATSMLQALGHDRSTHGAWNPFNNPCGDSIRDLVIHVVQLANNAADESDDADGAPDFNEWPVWNDLTHQKMWVDWIRRAHRFGLSVMVALAVNNKTLADATSGPCDYPTDDRNSATLQLAEIKGFVDRHKDFMEVALTADDLARIVNAGKLAIVLGVEIDNLGDLNAVSQPPSHAQIISEIDKLYSQGVRYIFPIHVLDNPFGGTATYQDLFNFSTFREDGHYWNLDCAPAPDVPSEAINYHFSSPKAVEVDLLNVAAQVKLHTSFADPPTYRCAVNPGPGQTNQLGLTDAGTFAIKEMMRRGMLIDIDHMSDLSKNAAIAIANGVTGHYPLNSGHASLRGFFPVSGFQTPAANREINERSMSAAQYKAIAQLHGMAGLGSGNLDAFQFAEMYQQVIQAMQVGAPAGVTVSAGFGTDTDGFAPGMPPRCKPFIDPSKSDWKCTEALGKVTYDDSFPMSGNWNYNNVGVAHYGMIPDFLLDVKDSPTEQSGHILHNLSQGAEYFYQTWKICEKQKSQVN
ncbi:MAG TPA: membrane dipeptidase [Candidatus Sulfotelmatobacter sp.]|nr:membrane dipeptidase [Candidatus Sulfotelmatobacter sp.]